MDILYLLIYFSGWLRVISFRGRIIKLILIIFYIQKVCKVFNNGRESNANHIWKNSMIPIWNFANPLFLVSAHGLGSYKSWSYSWNILCFFVVITNCRWLQSNDNQNILFFLINCFKKNEASRAFFSLSLLFSLLYFFLEKEDAFCSVWLSRLAYITNAVF